MSAMTIRPERAGDASAIRRLHEQAFGGTAEAGLVDRLRHTCPDSLSLVADDAGLVVGHILFTPVEIVGQRLTGMGLAPMAVLPDRQRQGIGSRLVRHGLDLLGARGCPFVIVLGHPEYYPRFGFERASQHGLASQWEDIPDAAFMVRIPDAAAMQNVAGVVKYRKEFDEVV